MSSHFKNIKYNKYFMNKDKVMDFEILRPYTLIIIGEKNVYSIKAFIGNTFLKIYFKIRRWSWEHWTTSNLFSSFWCKAGDDAILWRHHNKMTSQGLYFPLTNGAMELLNVSVPNALSLTWRLYSIFCSCLIWFFHTFFYIFFPFEMGQLLGSCLFSPVIRMEFWSVGVINWMLLDIVRLEMERFIFIWQGESRNIHYTAVVLLSHAYLSYFFYFFNFLFINLIK